MPWFLLAQAFSVQPIRYLFAAGPGVESLPFVRNPTLISLNESIDENSWISLGFVPPVNRLES